MTFVDQLPTEYLFASVLASKHLSSYVGDTCIQQWRRQRSKGATSFRGQKILQPGHPVALFFLKKLTTFSVVALKTQAANAVSPSK